MRTIPPMHTVRADMKRAARVPRAQTATSQFWGLRETHSQTAQPLTQSFRIDTSIRVLGVFDIAFLRVGYY
jgi:hypothetical protein